jgi:hypothetical protein
MILKANKPATTAAASGLFADRVGPGVLPAKKGGEAEATPEVAPEGVSVDMDQLHSEADAANLERANLSDFVSREAELLATMDEPKGAE